MEEEGEGRTGSTEEAPAALGQAGAEPPTDTPDSASSWLGPEVHSRPLFSAHMYSRHGNLSFLFLGGAGIKSRVADDFLT